MAMLSNLVVSDVDSDLSGAEVASRSGDVKVECP